MPIYNELEHTRARAYASRVIGRDHVQTRAREEKNEFIENAGASFYSIYYYYSKEGKQTKQNRLLGFAVSVFASKLQFVTEILLLSVPFN